MRALVIIGLVIAVSIPFAESLKCHFCESSISDLHCFQKRDHKDCYDTYTCAKTSYSIKGSPHFYRGCIAKSFCKDQDSYCRATKDRSNCEVYCCEGDYCNAGTVKTVSGMIMLTCAFIAIFV